MDIEPSECHFGYFNLEQLRAAYRILLQIKDIDLQYDNKGFIITKVITKKERENNFNIV